MNATEQLNALLATLPARGVKIVKKSSSLMWKLMGWIVYAITFGKNNSFTTGYITTINRTIGVPDNWDSWDDLSKLEILTHELTHVDQANRYTFLVMGFLYLFVFFPIGLAYFRYIFEREAYVNGFNLRLKFDPSLRDELISHGIDQMTTGQYGWAWLFKKSVRAYFEAHVAK